MEHIYQQSQFGEDWFTYPQFYKQIVERFPSGSTFVEVGSWKGKSSSFMAVEIANSGKNIDFYCVDHFLGDEQAGWNSSLYQIFMSNMEPLKDYYKVLNMPSVEAAEKFEDLSLDFVFIDAAHDYESVYSYLVESNKIINDGGVIGINDYTFWGWFEQQEYECVEAVNKFLNTHSDWSVVGYALGYCGYSDIYIKKDA